VLNHLFTTPVLHERLDPPRADFDALCDYLLALRDAAGGLQRSNRSGWHSDGNLFGEARRWLH
jgi:hypothetical protein